MPYRALNSATMVARRFVPQAQVSRWVAVSRGSGPHLPQRRGYRVFGHPELHSRVDARPRFLLKRGKGSCLSDGSARKRALSTFSQQARLMPDIPFLIAGGGPLAERVAAAADQLANLEYLGFVADSRGQEPAQTVSALRPPFALAGTGVTRRPRSDVGGNPDRFLPKGGSRRVCKRRRRRSFSANTDPRGLADTIASIYSDRAAWTRLSIGGQEGVAARHTMPSYLDRLRERLRIGRERRGPRERPEA